MIKEKAPTFLGEKIFRYKVVNGNGSVIYSVVTLNLTQSEVMYDLENKFENYYLPIRIFCNGKMIKRICK